MFYDRNTQSQSTLKPVSRASEEQAKVDDETSEMALYHYDSCFFCARVRKVIELLQLKIEFRNIMEHQSHALDLLGKGGSGTAGGAGSSRCLGRISDKRGDRGCCVL